MLKPDILSQIAAEHHTSRTEVEAEMKGAIHEAWMASTPAYRALFGDQEPSVAEVIAVVAVRVLGQ